MESSVVAFLMGKRNFKKEEAEEDRSNSLDSLDFDWRFRIWQQINPCMEHVFFRKKNKYMQHWEI